MVYRSQIEQVGEYLYEIPKHTRGDMRVPARFYADEKLLEMALGDRSLEQLINVTTLPGVVGSALAMPDAHQGYGFPIGGVAATRLPNGLISPGGVGYDINCGVRLLSTRLMADDVRDHVPDLMRAIRNRVATGVGAKGALSLTKDDVDQVCERGAEWVVARGMGRRRDLDHTEDGGRLTATADALSERARERGLNQLGTLGAGNHFIEVDCIAEVFDVEAAQAMGLIEGQLCIWIHCGSRGLGHQVCTDAVSVMQRVVARERITLPDRELAGAPLNSAEGQRYWQAMNGAANYAWANRQVITESVRHATKRVLGSEGRQADLNVVYDVCHNIAKIETHTVDGEQMDLCVHRKGATRAFGPGVDGVPTDYGHVGQPVLIPGNMKDGSYVLVGTERAMAETFGSCCHGAGRMMSRSQARKGVRGQDLRARLEGVGISVLAGSMRGLAEESPEAYKDLDRVVNVVHQAGIARMVARTLPLGVIKG